MNEPEPFDYATLGEDAGFVRETTRSIHDCMERNRQDSIKIGRQLDRIKRRLGHGKFGSWIRAEFSLSMRTAQRFMNTALKYDKTSEMPRYMNHVPLTDANSGAITVAEERTLKQANAKMRSQLQELRDDRNAKVALINEQQNQLSKARNEIACLEDELQRVKKITAESATESEERIMMFGMVLTNMWSLAPPRVKHWFMEQMEIHKLTQGDQSDA